MKRQFLALLLFALSMHIVPAFGMKTIRHALGLDKEGTKTVEHRVRTAGSIDKKQKTVDFWNKVVRLLKKDGYAEDSNEMKHARKGLKRAEYRLAHPEHKKHKRHKRHHKAHTVKKETTTKQKKNNESEKAYQRGRKAGEAHERRVLKKKAGDLIAKKAKSVR